MLDKWTNFGATTFWTILKLIDFEINVIFLFTLKIDIQIPDALAVHNTVAVVEIVVVAAVADQSYYYLRL